MPRRRGSGPAAGCRRRRPVVGRTPRRTRATPRRRAARPRGAAAPPRRPGRPRARGGVAQRPQHQVAPWLGGDDPVVRGEAGAVGDHVADGDGLQPRVDPRRAQHAVGVVPQPAVGQAVEPLRRVVAGPAVAHLRQPGPDRLRRPVDGDAAVPHHHRLGDHLVTGKRGGDLGVADAGAAGDVPQDLQVGYRRAVARPAMRSRSRQRASRAA